MYDEMTISDLLVVAHQQAHPEDQPSAEHAPLIDELVTRLRRLDVWRSQVSAEINPYLTDEDGSDLMPEPHRIRYMLQRLSSAHLTPVPVSERLPGPGDCDAEGRCWWGKPYGYRGRNIAEPYWIFGDSDCYRFMACALWLPANVLPLPSGEVK